MTRAWRATALGRATALWRATALTLCALLAAVVTAQAPQTAATAAAGETLTLERALELAEASQSVGAAEAQLELARLSLAAAQYPVSMTAGGGATLNTDFGSQGTSLGLDANLSASLRTPWGATSEAVAAAERAVAAAEAAVVTAKGDAVVAVVKLYAAAVQALATQSNAAVQLEIATLQADAARARREVGAVLDADVTLAELTQQSAALDKVAADAAVARAYTDLAQALGVNVVGLAGDPPAGNDAFLEEDAAERLVVRLDVLAAQRDVAAAADALAAASRASGVSVTGNVSVSGGAGATSVSLGASLDSRDLTPSLSARLSSSIGQASGSGASWRGTLGVSASVPLGPPDTRVASAQLSQAQAEARLAQTLAAASVEVTALRLQAQADDARVSSAATRLELAKAAAEAAATRFDLGVINRVDVLQAQSTLLQAEAALQGARYDRLLDLVALARALGHEASEVLR